MLQADNTTAHTHSQTNCVVAVPGPRCIIQRYKNMRHMDSSYIAAGPGPGPGDQHEITVIREFYSIYPSAIIGGPTSSKY